MTVIADFAGLSVPVFLFCFAAITIATAVQRLSGQGYGLVAAPLVALVAPQLLPGGLLLLGVAAGLGAAGLDMRHIAMRELPPGFAGRALGAVLAAMVAASLPFEKIALIVALVVLLAVGLSLKGFALPIRRATLFGAGLVAGLMGTLTAIGAPPMALLYQRSAPQKSRAMQSTFFLFGMVVSIAALAWQGLIGAAHLRFAAVLLPAILLGIVISQPLARRFTREMVRPAAMLFSTAAALILLGKVLLG